LLACAALAASWLGGCSDNKKGGSSDSDADTDTDSDSDTDTDSDTDGDTDTGTGPEDCSEVTTEEFVPTGTEPEGDSPSDIEFSPDGAMIVIAHRDSQNLTVFDSGNLQDVLTIPVTGSPNDVAIGPSSTIAVTANIFEDTASIVDLVAGEETDVVELGCDQPGEVEIAPDGTFAIVLCTMDGTFAVVDIATAAVGDTVVLEGIGASTSFGVWAIAYSFSPFVITPDSGTLIAPLPYADPDPGVAFVDLGTLVEDFVVTTDNPWSIALSEDGQTAVVAHGYPNTDVTVLDVPTRAIDLVMQTGGDATTSPPLAITPDGTRACVAVQNSVRVLDLVSETASADLTSGTPGSLYTTADGDHCFVGAWNGPLIDYAAETVVATLLDSTTPDYAAASPTEPLAATAHILRKETMEVVNVDGADGYYVAEVPTGEPPEGDKARRVAVTADGSLAVVIHNHSKNAAFVDPAGLEVLGYADLGERPGEVEITPDGSLAVVTNLDESFVTVIDLETFEPTDIEISRRGGQVEISPDGSHAFVGVVADGDGVWRIDLDDLVVDGTKISTGEMGGVAGGFDASSGMRLSHDGATLVTCNSFDNTISVIDAESWQIQASVPVGTFPVRAEFSPDDSEIYVSNWDGASVTVVENAGSESAALETIAVGENPYEIEVHPLWPVIYVGNYTGKSVSVVDLDAGETTDTIPLPETSDAGQPVDLALSASGTFLFAACMGGDVHRIDTYELEIAETVNIGLAPAQIVYSEATRCVHVPSPYGDDGLAVICFCQE